MNKLRYFFREIKNIFEFFLIPFLALFLPQKIYFFLFKKICRYTFFYGKYSQNSYANANYLLSTLKIDETTWNTRVKLLYLMDITDLWLARFRPKKMLKTIIRSGSWEKSQGHLLLGLHYGPGYITLLDLKQHELEPYFVFAQAQVPFHYQSKVESFYRKIRIKHVNSLSGSMAISTGGGYEKIKKVVKNKGVPIILYDAPRFENKTNSKAKNTVNFHLTVLQRKYQVASGFINLICQETIPYQLYNVQLDFETGHKKINILPLKSTADEKTLLPELSKYMQTLITDSPEQWFFWRQSPDLFSR